MTTNNETLKTQTTAVPDQAIIEQIRAVYNPQALEIAYSQFVAASDNAGKTEEDLKSTFDFHINELALKGLMLIPVVGIKQAHLKEMKSLISFLQSFFIDTKKKKETILTMDNAIVAKIKDLCDKNIIKLNQEEFERSQSVIHEYYEALDGVCDDIQAQIDRFVMFETMPLPSVTSIFYFEPNNFADYLPAKIKQVKKSMKKLQSDINVGYSQYFVKLDEHEKQLTYLEKSAKVTK